MPGEPKDHALGYSRGGYGSKLHLVTDGKGIPLGVKLTAGQTNESTQAIPLIKHTLQQIESMASEQHITEANEASLPENANQGTTQASAAQPVKPAALAGDKGYSSKEIRQELKALGIRVIIPHKSNETLYHNDPEFNKELYKRRHVIEQCNGWLKENRRIGTRFEKYAVNFLAMIELAFIRRYMRVLAG